MTSVDLIALADAAGGISLRGKLDGIGVFAITSSAHGQDFLPLNTKAALTTKAKMIKIIFLDIDGVLNWFQKLTDPGIPNHEWSPEVMKSFGIKLEAFDPCIERLNKITDATGALIVLSTSWRKGYLADYADVVTFLKDRGVKAFIIGRTPWGNGYKCRGEEIQAWVTEHEAELDTWVILDDHTDMGLVLNKLIQTEHDVGLTDDHVERAIKVLNGA